MPLVKGVDLVADDIVVDKSPARAAVEPQELFSTHSSRVLTTAFTPPR